MGATIGGETSASRRPSSGIRSLLLVLTTICCPKLLCAALHGPTTAESWAALSAQRSKQPGQSFCLPCFQLSPCQAEQAASLSSSSLLCAPKLVRCGYSLCVTAKVSQTLE